GYSMRYLIVSKVCNAVPERSQKICSARVLQLRQLSMMSNPYGVSTTTPRFSSFSRPHYPNTSCHMQQVLRSPGVVTWTFMSGLKTWSRRAGNWDNRDRRHRQPVEPPPSGFGPLEQMLVLTAG